MNVQRAPEARRVLDKPIVSGSSHPGIGTNIAGPSLIRVPDWVPEPLGRLYLYFADHKGDHIRLAYADDVTGPWTVHEPGALSLAESGFAVTEPSLANETFTAFESRYRELLGEAMPMDLRADLVTCHVASPDVHVCNEHRELHMFFHGLVALGDQQTKRAVSSDGLRWLPDDELLGPAYFRVFRHDDMYYALVMPGVIYRSRDPQVRFEKGPTLFGPEMRHSAVRVTRAGLEVFWTRCGDAPERILYSVVDLAGPWDSWKATPPKEVLRPQRLWEGAGLQIEPSRRGAVFEPVNQLRDPCVFDDPDHTGLWLLYAVAGESGIGLAELR